MLARTQQAIGQTTEAQVYRDGMLGDTVSLAVLHDHEWPIAATLRDLTAVGAEAQAMGSEESGPLAAEVATAQRRARDLVRTRMKQDVEAVERLARAAADGAATEIDELTSAAEIAGEAMRLTLSEAGHAAEVLAVPRLAL